MRRPKIASPSVLRSSREHRALPEPVAPPEPYTCDVVVPFWSGDAQWLPECVEALLQQNHCAAFIHVISDGCEFPVIPERTRILRYRHGRRTNQGPYRLTNALVRHGHCRTGHLAMQDADDLSLPDRLWRQMSTLEQTGAVMISSAMEQFTGELEMGARREREPVARPGLVCSTVPDGRCVNSTRLMRLDFFQSLNGFQNLTCTGDFEFDNRARFSRLGKIINDQNILARRRLHMASLSHGIAPEKSHLRNLGVEAIRRSLKAVRNCKKCAPNFGALKTAFELEVI